MANKRAVLGRPFPDANVPRNAFDRSSRRQFHYQLGALTCPWFEPCIAGTHLKLNRKIFQRTADVNTAAFPKMDTHIQYYFVPFRQLWSQWDDFKLNISDFNSSALAPFGQSAGVYAPPSRVPYVNTSQLGQAINTFETNQIVDELGFNRSYNARKLLNMLGYGEGEKGGLISSAIDVNIWPILAYHKIYYDHFRNTAYESNNPKYYNMDYLYSNAVQISNVTMKPSDAEVRDLLHLHYVNYRQDYFTNLYPSLNYVQSDPSGLSWNNPPNLVGLGSYGSNLWNSGTSNPSLGSSYLYGPDLSSSTPPSGVQILSVNAIRSAFALDKLMRSSAYAPKHAKDQYEARFGIKFRNNPNESIFIGSFMNDIQIGEVTSTAATDINGQLNPLGAIGGKGVSFDDFGKTLEFDCQEDGIVMAICYTTMRSSYRSLGIDSYLTKHVREDYFQPEFQDLGLEPVYGAEFSRSAGYSIIMGYHPRNQRYKIGIDKNYGLFSDINSDMYQFINHTDVGRIPTGNGVNYSWFKVRPTDLNGVMRVDFDGSWATDQFITDCEFGCTAIQNMSIHGQPSL